VSQGNTTGVHLRLKFFVEYDQNGKKSGTQKVRFLLLTDSTAKNPKEPIDIYGWKREYENSKAFVGVRALPSFENRASGRGHLNDADLEISEQRKLVKPLTPRVVSPIQGATVNFLLPIQGDQSSQAATDATDIFAATPPIPPGYWDSPQARGLFQPRPEERSRHASSVELTSSTVSSMTGADSTKV
jgi:hypothetical protein